MEPTRSIVTLKSNWVRIGDRFSVSFQRTLRIPDDGRTYPLPPSLGLFPIRMVGGCSGKVPEGWQPEDMFLPIYPREALWLGFEAARWKPNAVKVGVGRINAVTGLAWDESLSDAPQDYLVCPNQPWLDGIKVGPNLIRQFVATRHGRGDTIEGQLSGSEQVGGIQILAFEPKAGRFPDEPPPVDYRSIQRGGALASAPMGIGAGGTMEQKVYPDPFGLDTWDQDRRGGVHVHLVDPEQYRDLTGEEPPPSPVTAETYTRYGFPWFALEDEAEAELPATDRLKSVRSLNERDGARTGKPFADPSVEIDPDQVAKLPHLPEP